MRGKRYFLTDQWETAIDGWICWMTAAGLSAETVRTRRSAVRRVARASRTTHPERIDAEWLIKWCGRQAWSTDHRRTIRVSLRDFYDWCLRTQLCTINPATGLPKAPESRPRPQPVPDTAWEALLALAGQRERLMARLACEAGLRRAEVARVHRDDIFHEADGWSLVVHGKGARNRTVALTESLAADIRAYSPGCYNPRGFLFPGGVDGHLSPNCVGKLVSALLPDGWSMHKLRHRFASRGFAGTRNLPAVQAALGHASLATTERYVATARSDVRAVAESAA